MVNSTLRKFLKSAVAVAGSSSLTGSTGCVRKSAKKSLSKYAVGFGMLITVLFCIVLTQCNVTGTEKKINRQAVVGRYTIHSDSLNTKSPAQAGNGKFAFGADITGLQTFVPFNTLSDWSWHSFPVPDGLHPEDFKGDTLKTHDRMIGYCLPL
jgi:hypothetical protein